MSSPSRTYQAEIYEQFHEIEETAFHDMVLFYERNAGSIDNLEMDAYFEIRCCYAVALFEIGRYRDYISMSQGLLEGLIYHNVGQLHGEDLYGKVLLKRASAHYQLLEYDKAEHILRQLVGMNPSDGVAVFLLKRTLVRNQPKFVSDLKGVSILLFLAAATLIAIELLIIRSFLPEWASTIEGVRTGIFISGAVLLICTDVVHRIRSFRSVNQKIMEIRRKQSRAKE